MKRKKKTAPRNGVFSRLGSLYERMGNIYSQTSAEAGLTCEGCQKNCCVSYFQHRTYIEWDYLWKGLYNLPDDKRMEYISRAESVVRQSDAMLAQGLRPQLMCPLNDEGKCGLYEYRLMICRMHGTRNTLTLPDNSIKTFPGCYRFQELMEDHNEENIPTIDRTELYKELFSLEVEFVGKAKLQTLPRVNLTLSQMIAYGPPKVK